MIAAAGIAMSSSVLVTGAGSRALTCDPLADTSVWDNFQATAEGSVINNCSSSWSYTLKLVNRAGTALRTNTGNGSGHAWLNGTLTGCAGAYIHGFLYLNVSGTGKSFTSGENADCAY